MFSRPRGVERAFPSDVPPTVAGTEEARAFFQARLATLGLAMFLLAGSTWPVLVHVSWASRSSTPTAGR